MENKRRLKIQVEKDGACFSYHPSYLFKPMYFSTRNCPSNVKVKGYSQNLAKVNHNKLNILRSYLSTNHTF